MLPKTPPVAVDISNQSLGLQSGEPSADTAVADSGDVTLIREEPSSISTENDSPRLPTKMAQATEIYRRMTRKKGTTRKEIVAVFIDDVGLTKSGAATYYQMIKKGRR